MLVDNKPGVLTHVSGLISRRAFNIESISAGYTEERDVTRINIEVSVEDDRELEQVVHQLGKLIDVIKIVNLGLVDSIVRELVLLLAKRADMDADGRLDAAKVRAFYLAQGEMIEVYSDTLHFCPCEVTENGFSCIVCLQRGTNLPRDIGKESGTCLWAANKWLIAHEENASLVARGAFPGIYGENWEIHPIV